MAYNDVTWTEITLPDPILGEGWSGTGPYHYMPADTLQALTYHFNFKTYHAYEITFTCESTGEGCVNVDFSQYSVRPNGLNQDFNMSTSTTVLQRLGANFQYLHIIPSSGWSGQFQITRIREALPSPNYIARGSSIFLGGGGSLSTGGQNIAIGDQSLNVNTTGSSNIATGYRALCSNTRGSNNIATGAYSLYFNTTGSDNIATGQYSLLENATGSQNTAIGNYSLSGNKSGSDNISIGTYALYSNEIGSHNLAAGEYSLFFNSDGDYNIALGDIALYQNRSGYTNSAFGCGALKSNVSGSYNTACGSSSLMDNRTGSLNTAVGLVAGTGGSYDNSTFAGAYSRGTNGSTNETVIGYQAVGNGSNTITLGNSDIERLYCNTTAITALSDRRIKEEIEDADLNRCLDTVKQLKVSRYKYKDFVGKHNDKHVTGFLADDVEKVFPKSVSKNDKAFPVLDEDGKPVYEVIPETEETKGLPEEARRRPKTFVMEDVKDITMTEAVPTLWGAVQALLEREEKSSELIQALLQRENELLERVNTLEEALASLAK